MNEIGNKNAAIFELAELEGAASRLICDIESGEYDADDSPSYAVALEHLMSHLVRAWHHARMSDEQIDKLSPDEMMSLDTAVPNLCGLLRMVESDESFEEILRAAMEE